MTLKEFGASVKAKYPEYQQYDDEIIGQKMLEKYPEYKDRIDTSTQPQPNVAQQALQTVGGVAKAINPNLVGYLQNMTGQVNQGNLTPTQPNVADVSASVMGPGVEMLLQSLMGTPEQKQKQGAIRELTADVETAKLLGGLGKGVYQGVSTVGKGISGAKSLSPIKIASYLRKEAADKAGEVTTKSLIKAGDDFVNKNPLAQDVWDVFKPTISEKMPANELLDRMSSVFGQAYTKTGDVRTSAQAQLMNQLYQAGKWVLKDQAPEVAKYTSGIRQIITAPKDIQKLTWLLAKLGLAKGAF